MTQRIVIGRILKHSDQHGRLLGLQVSRLLAEIDIGRRLDSDRVVEEVKTVEIHIDNLILSIEPFELDGDHPLYRLLHRTPEHI